MSASPSTGSAVSVDPGHELPITPREPTLVLPEEGYERWADTYDQFSNPLLAREERHVLSSLPDLCGKVVLDAACGTGRWLQRFLERGARLGAGIDSSTAMLGVASRKPDIRSQLARADCMQLPFRDSVFDFAVCSFAVSHIQDLKQAAIELARVTKTHAEVVISDLHPEAYSGGWRTGFRDIRGACQIKMVSRSAEEIVQSFHVGGFECLKEVSLCLGEPERTMFAQAGKSRFFIETVQIPAVLVCHFQRRGLGI